MDLDYQGDPAWECLVQQKDWLLKLLTSCQDDHKAKGECSLISSNCRIWAIMTVGFFVLFASAKKYLNFDIHEHVAFVSV